MMLKNGLHRLIRSANVALFRRAAPEKISVYMHATQGHEHALDELIAYLRREGYAFLGPGEFLRASGKATLLSFDDNFRSWMDVLPVLEKHQARATFYVNSWPFRDRVGPVEMRSYFRRIGAEEEDTLNTAELVAIAAAGHVIGAHTHTHPVLSKLPIGEAKEEICRSKEELEAILQRPVRDFAYPYGMRRHFSHPLRQYCRSIGFETIANGIPCLQYAASQQDDLHRSPWLLNQPFVDNLDNLCTDGRAFHALTGRSAIGKGIPS